MVCRFPHSVVRSVVVLGMSISGCLTAGPGCGGHPRYPEAWPAVHKPATQSCERLAGRHANTGERGQVQENGSVYLTEMLFLIPHRSESETVELSFPRAGQLDVSIAAPGFPPRVLSLRRKADDFKCKGGSLMITPSAEWTHGFANAVPIVAGESVTMKVDLIGDGLLVTRQDAQFMWVPFPFRTTWSSWYRFLPAATSEPVP